MTKRDLVVRISEETGLVQQDVLNVVQKTLDYISDAVTKGQKVELRNFGVFEVKVRKARVGRNPNAPEADVPIPPRAVVKPLAVISQAVSFNVMPPPLISRITGRCVAACSAAFLDHAAAARAAPSRSAGRRFP